MALRWTTGEEQVDSILGGVVGVFETVFPGRVRAYYLTGSFADGTAVAASDLDLQVVFRDALTAEEERTARRLLDACSRLTPVGLDALAIDEARLADFGPPDLKLGGRLVYGEDVRDRWPLVPVALWARALMHELPRFLARVRSDPPLLMAPLGYPDPGGEFYGYDARVLPTRDGRRQRTTKDLVRLAGGAASALVAWRAGRYVLSKRECPGTYRAAFGDEDGWADYLEDLDRTCRAELGYLLPECPAARRRVRALCARGPALENHFLDGYRELLLADLTRPPTTVPAVPLGVAAVILGVPPPEVAARLASGALPAVEHEGRRLPAGGPVLQAWAARALARVVYPADGALAAALASQADSDVPDVRRLAREALRSQQAAAQG